MFFKKKTHSLKAYADGQLLSIEKVNDEVFSKKMMGDGVGSSTLVQSFKKVKNFKSPLFIDDLKFFCCQVLKFYVACVVCVAPLLYNILEVFDHETLV